VTATAFRERLRAGEALTGVFVKTASHQVIEVLAASGTVDVAVIDTEHGAFDPSQLDAMLAVAHALQFPCLVRVAAPAPVFLQVALDGGATGVLVPHVATGAMAAQVSTWSRYGDGGRGYSGSTRSAGWGTRSMENVLARAAAATTVVVQVEDVAAVDAAGDIAAADGVDAVFIGMADLTVGLGCTDPSHPSVRSAVDSIIAATQAAGCALAAISSGPADTEQWRRRGVMFAVESTDHARLRHR
jgi:2-keto-3-deoxy-L-rhamnonate aldolase RhmA